MDRQDKPWDVKINVPAVAVAVPGLDQGIDRGPSTEYEPSDDRDQDGCAGEAGVCQLRSIDIRTTVMPAPILTLTDLPAHLPPRGALIGLDLGTKTIGVATSDPDRRLAIGVETVARTRFSVDAKRLLALATQRKAVAFVLGLPVN